MRGGGPSAPRTQGLFVPAALTLAIALAAAGCGGGGQSSTTVASVPETFDAEEGMPFADPPQLESQDGVLQATLTADEGTASVSGIEVQGKFYNGSYPGPTMVVSPGDTIELSLVNDLDSEKTNIHFHGFHTSPSGIADNIFREIEPGTTGKVVVPVPRDMAPGTYWYHSHQHPTTEEQVFTGLSGAIVVRGLEDRLPPDLQDITQRQIILKDLQVKDGAIVSHGIDSGSPTTRTVNGLVDPTMTIAPGETQLWRLANIGADIWYHVSLEGQPLRVIAEDGNPVGKVWSAKELLLPPGKRYDVLVQGPPEGTYQLKTLAMNTGPAGDKYPERTLATLTSTGDAEQPATLPTSMGPMPDLQDAHVDRYRRLVFSESPNGNQFFINGKQFDHHVVNIHAQLGDTEQWTIVNVSDELHPFHIHVNDFQVMSINGEPYDAKSLQDTIPLPYGGKVVIRQQYTQYTGVFVYHCHILAHEDNGMMGVIQVQGPDEKRVDDPMTQ